MMIKGKCPKCKENFLLNIKENPDNPGCQNCKVSFNKLAITEIAKTKTISVCPICGSNDFWVEKKFPKKIGVVLVIIAAILVPFTWGLSFIILFLVDMVLWFVLGWRINCYQCESEFTGLVRNNKIKPFDLKVYEYYKESGLSKN